jgi:hypothetical protein
MRLPSEPPNRFTIQAVWDNDALLQDLEIKGLDSFIEITQPEESILALNWHHACYRFNPRLHQVNPKADGIFKIPFYSNGDYYIFLTEDFENVWFGHPWQETITLIGQRLIEAANHHLPLAFTNQSTK